MKLSMLKQTLSVFLILGLAVSHVTPVFAVDTSADKFLGDKAYNNLINDSSFIDINSMSVADIQNFLAGKGSVLATVSPGSLGGGANGRSAAQIIYDTAHAADSASSGPPPDGDFKGIKVNSTTGTVSPKIILTYLEKEQGLVSGSEANQNKLDCAMGYDLVGQGCTYMFENYPAYRGFAAQVGNGAWQLRYDYEYALRGTKPLNATQHYIVNEEVSLYGEGKYNNPESAYYNPARYGPFTVKFSNAATATAFSYTPYVFDSAYNFWKIFNDWFTASPDVVTEVPNDTSDYVIKTYLDSVTVGGRKSNQARVFFTNQLIADRGVTNWQVTFSVPVGTSEHTVVYKDVSENLLGTKKITVTRHQAADINGDAKVDIQDLSLMAANWGQNKPAEALADINSDDIVDILDLSSLASNWSG